MSPRLTHVPTAAEWDKLTTTAGAFDEAGGKLKSARTSPDSHPRWLEPNLGATNQFDFSALPEGWRDTWGDFGYLGNKGVWWSSNSYNDDYARGIDMSDTRASVYTTVTHKRVASSVRCVRD